MPGQLSEHDSVEDLLRDSEEPSATESFSEACIDNVQTEERESHSEACSGDLKEIGKSNESITEEDMYSMTRANMKQMIDQEVSKNGEEDANIGEFFHLLDDDNDNDANNDNPKSKEKMMKMLC